MTAGAANDDAGPYGGRAAPPARADIAGTRRSTKNAATAVGVAALRRAIRGDLRGGRCLSALRSGSLINEATIDQIKASDTWTEYQSAREKEHLYTVAIGRADRSRVQERPAHRGLS